MQLCEVRCRWCGLPFFICRRCWRGQGYCCDECRRFARQKSHREAQRRYRQSPKGKKAHREAENRRRHGLSEKGEKKMDDLSSTPLPWWCMRFVIDSVLVVQSARGRVERCHFCGAEGVLVDGFSRRGYGGR